MKKKENKNENVYSLLPLCVRVLCVPASLNSRMLVSVMITVTLNMVIVVAVTRNTFTHYMHSGANYAVFQPI